ncbi:hypothetical protein LCGC14_0967140 [marine sediment metagenome]|uniref:Uncharacterized protein n=1 Tax=marine sediment metagenome TaxID=412755 RepID=A0A0F9NCX1_9ZZZZ
MGLTASIVWFVIAFAFLVISSVYYIKKFIKARKAKKED